MGERVAVQGQPFAVNTVNAPFVIHLAKPMELNASMMVLCEPVGIFRPTFFVVPSSVSFLPNLVEDAENFTC